MLIGLKTSLLHFTHTQAHKSDSQPKELSWSRHIYCFLRCLQLKRQVHLLGSKIYWTQKNTLDFWMNLLGIFPVVRVSLHHTPLQLSVQNFTQPPYLSDGKKCGERCHCNGFGMAFLSMCSKHNPEHAGKYTQEDCHRLGDHQKQFVL